MVALAAFLAAALFGGFGVWRGAKISGPLLKSPHFPVASMLLLISVFLFFHALAEASKP